MLSKDSLFISNFKAQSKTLHLACFMAIQHNLNISSFEQNLKILSLQQCNEVLAKGHGFNSYKALLVSEMTECEVKLHLLKAAVEEHLIINNSFDDMGLSLGVDWFCSKRFEHLPSEILEIFSYLNAFGFMDAVYVPKEFYTASYDLSWNQLDDRQRKGNRLDHLLTEFLLNIVIENYEFIDVIKTRDKAIIKLPLNRVYKHKIRSLIDAQSFLKRLCDSINNGHLAYAQAGEFDIENYERSYITIELKLEHMQGIEGIAAFNKIIKNALDLFHASLKEFGSFLVVLEDPKRLRGTDAIRYYLFKYYLFKILITQVHMDNDPLYLFKFLNGNVGQIEISTLSKIISSADIQRAVGTFKEYLMPELYRIVEIEKEYRLQLKSAINGGKSENLIKANAKWLLEEHEYYSLQENYESRVFGVFERVLVQMKP